MAREVKLCLLGDTGVGKTCLVLRFVTNTYNENSECTVGASFMTKAMVVDNKTIKFHIWDTAGQERYRGLAPMYYRGAAAAILVYDITSQASFENIQSWVKELHQLGPADIVLAIAGNKCDLEEDREVPRDEAQQYADRLGAVFVETSALEAKNVSELFIAICKRLPAVESDGTQEAVISGGIRPLTVRSEDGSGSQPFHPPYGGSKKRGCCA